MASVYVSGDDARSLVQFVDESHNNDHTYYGMGCPNYYGKDGSTGSDVPCSTRVIQDGDGDDQKIGTYYSGQAGMTGSIVKNTGLNHNAPDTFCPLGWQLPYGGTGGDYYDKSRSWKYLFTLYGENGALPTGSTTTKYPHSLIGSGEYYWAIGRLYNMFGYSGGHYLTLTSGNEGQSMSRLSIWNTLSIEYINERFGEAIRCDCRISNLKAPHGIRVHSLAFWLFIF